MTLTTERLREALHYDSETGVFRRITRIRGAKLGAIAGCNSRGYLVIGLDRKQYLAHRLAWFYVYGAWPTSEIDHINGIKSDNRVCNLRDVSHATNQQNQRQANKDSSSGILGVRRHYLRWAARIRRDGIEKHLGVFDTQDEAHAAYLEAKRQLHPGNTL